MINDKKILELFKERYVLDNTLQRSYEWHVDRVVKLINDIRTCKFKNSGGGYCRYNIGDFITYINEEEDNFNNNFKYLCDGQQRLTTLTILFANILHHHPSNKAIEGALKQLLYKTTIDTNGLEKKVKVLTLKRDDDKILKKIIDCGTETLTKEEKKNNLVKVYNKISDVFTKVMNADELNDFYNSIIQNASYFERECESQEEAIKQFNNLNGGQQTISKSRIGITTLYAIYNKTKTVQEKEIEQFLYNISNMDDKKQKELLCLYIHYRSKENRESDIPKIISELAEKNKDILNDILRFYTDIYVKHIENNNNPFMEQTSLRQTWVDLYTDKYEQIKDIDDKEKNKAYKKCEWAYICNRIKNGGSGEKNLFSGIFGNFCENCGNLTEYVVTKLKEKGIYETVDVISTYKVNKNNKGNELFTRLLLNIENEYKNELGIKEEVTHCSKATLEHIHPQNSRTTEVYLCDDVIINRFGNKTIIGDEANKSLSNKTFDKKKLYYSNSPYYINSKHLCKYSEWTNETVEKNEHFYFDMLKKHYML